MTTQRLQDYLREQQVDFETVTHPHAFTAAQTAASAHIDGHAMAKTVMVRLDGKLAMAVLPSNEWLDIEQLRKAAGAGEARLASESEFRDRFPECEVGAMPPFGNLYGMEVYVADSLSDDERIAFNAGNHRELMWMRWRDFERLVHPHMASLTRH
ncbi:aminoacyl-tRNA deacylase [Marilutibacter chinensis]|uniref:YbaK/EbsC family protein n=1 Tax=Marilutibacter chinensis TaxID=2912247 RepID=A0ABS9HPG4_9GAMM|nr:YbaK/EbsC family protein [Lysobacter chinensis]MCF7220197.1 YbaK/EbsC family protein [Lysobacter chinensis]